MYEQIVEVRLRSNLVITIVTDKLLVMFDGDISVDDIIDKSLLVDTGRTP